MSYSGYDSGYSRETKGSNEERYSKLNRDTNQRSTFEESNDFNRNEDCKIDSEKTEKFVVKISHFPFEINEPEINDCINIHFAKNYLCNQKVKSCRHNFICKLFFKVIRRTIKL